MPRSMPHKDIFSAIDRLFDAERERIEAKRDLAKRLFTWLESQASELVHGVPLDTETRTALIPIDRRELTVKDLAKIWGVSTRSIYEWRLTGGLPFKKHGRLLRFDWIEADAWSKRHQEAFTKARLRVVR